MRRWPLALLALLVVWLSGCQELPRRTHLDAEAATWWWRARIQVEVER